MPFLRGLLPFDISSAKQLAAISAHCKQTCGKAITNLSFFRSFARPAAPNKDIQFLIAIVASSRNAKGRDNAAPFQGMPSEQ